MNSEKMNLIKTILIRASGIKFLDLL